MIRNAYVAAFACAIALSGSAFSEEADPQVTLFTNVNVFDGVNEELIENASVVVTDNLVSEVATEPLAVAGGKVIDGGGRTLIPGLIDVHQHVTTVALPDDLVRNKDLMWVGIRSADQAKKMLLRGFTTIRDAGGPSISLMKEINAGTIPGPRIYPSGRFITQTSGHGDFRAYNDPHPNMEGRRYPGTLEQFTYYADGVPEVLRGVRENLRLGATQIKLMVGGGGGSQYDPLHTVQFREDEVQAAVDAAADWGTYVMIHAYNDESIRRSLEAGVKGVDHGTLMSEKSMKLLKSRNGYLVPQARLFTVTDADKAYFEGFGAATLAKVLELNEAMDNQMKLAVKHKVKIGFGTDLMGTEEKFRQQSEEFEARAKWFSPYEILVQATSNGADIVALSGKLNPYTEGELGVIKKGAYADLLLVDGNPLEDISLLGDPENKLVLIMKDGVIYKNTLRD